MPDEFLPPAPQPNEKLKRRRTKDDVGYGINAREGRLQIRYNRPEVATHVARILIANNMDYEAAVARMLTAAAKDLKLDAPSDETIIRQAEILRGAPTVQEALQRRLKDIGLDDDAQKLLVSLAWNAALDRRNDKRWPAAMKLLGEWTGMAQKNRDDKPEPLNLGGADKMLDRMGLGKPSNELEEIEDDGILRGEDEADEEPGGEHQATEEES